MRGAGFSVRSRGCAGGRHRRNHHGHRRPSPGDSPRESFIESDIGGVCARTSACPTCWCARSAADRVCSSNGGEVQVGPESVGYRLTTEAVVFGGSTVTATDVAVAAGHADIGDRARARQSRAKNDGAARPKAHPRHRRRGRGPHEDQRRAPPADPRRRRRGPSSTATSRARQKSSSPSTPTSPTPSAPPSPRSAARPTASSPTKRPTAPKPSKRPRQEASRRCRSRRRRGEHHRDPRSRRTPRSLRPRRLRPRPRQGRRQPRRHPPGNTPMKLQGEDLLHLATGAAFLGAGGGGDPYLGRLLARAAIDEFGAPELRHPNDVEDTPPASSPSPCSAPPRSCWRRDSPAKKSTSRSAAWRNTSARTADYLMPLEIGGINSPRPHHGRRTPGPPADRRRRHGPRVPRNCR